MKLDSPRTLKLALVAGAAFALQGCVAAVVPLAASGLVGGATVSGGRDAQPEAASPAVDPTVIVAQSQSTPEPQVAAVPAATPVIEQAEPGLATPVEAEVVSAAPPPDIQPVPAAVGAVGASTALTTPTRAPVVSATAREIALTPVPDIPPTQTPEPASAAPLPTRIIAVDPQVALADSTRGARNVSAAEMAAALAADEGTAEVTAPAARLSRLTPASQPQPAASSAATNMAEAAPDPAPVAAAPAASLAARATPAVDTAPAPTGPTVRTLATGPFASLINYATRQQSTSADERRSAVLADRASLQPDRAQCGAGEPTVLIDLDPEGEIFDPTNARRAAPGLSSALAQLRASGVKVAWVSRNPQGQVGAIRTALNRSGLDLDNSDQLLLMRYPEDRKQTRREDLAAGSCLVAIAGDKRTDFDELFEYLLDPSAAATLDPLIGNGWFLIPQPLLDERPNP